MVVLNARFLATAGRFFFSDGSSLEPSAGLLTPPTEENQVPKGRKKMSETEGYLVSRVVSVLTGGPPVEVVVVLRDVG